MAKKRKKKTEEISRTAQIKLNEIASKLGTTISMLVETYGEPEKIIEDFESGKLQLLNE